MTGRRFIALAAMLACALGASSVQAKERYYAFEPDNESARFRSADLTITVRQGLMGSTVKRIYRERGADLGLEPAGKTFGEREALRAIGEGQFELQLYAVNAKDGEGFAHGACKGASRAWIAFRPIHPYEGLRMYVLKYDEAAHAPALCETLDYRWRGEFLLPTHQNLAEPEAQ